MSNVILPTLIQGPCYLVHGGIATYFKNGLQVSDEVQSWTPDSDFGKLGERHKSRTYKLSGVPVGMLTTGYLDYVYAAHKAPATKIGHSIITGAAVICSLAESKTYSFNKAGIFTPPNLMAGPSGTIFEQITYLAIGDVSVQPTNAAFLKTITDSLTPDTTFDETKIVSDIYKGALGSRTSPFDGIGSMTGFKFNFSHDVKLIETGDVGIGDAILKDCGAGASFIPSNLTEANCDSLLGIQDTTAVLPGQEYGKGVSGAKEDLVITGTQVGWVFTLKNAGAKKQDRQYLVGEHRHKELQFVNAPVTAAGVRSAYFAYTAPS